MTTINESLHFKGSWRTYQKRVLDQSSTYLQDKKIHIVAAPGSGKTTLGIELIRRAGSPCLILSPSIVIRQQWLSRIEEAFLTEAADSSSLLSADIRKPAPITAITYQALHSAMTRRQSSDEENNENAEECETELAIDYSGFDLLRTVKETGITTICLDECHHLKNEWWKALETFIAALKDVTIISLTATPPYDSTPAQWERYISLCGSIDEEIIVPELVREGSLCPHQDYIYFNYPTKEEEASVRKFKKDAQETMHRLMTDDAFARMIATHAGLGDIASYEERFLEYPAYLSSLLIFLNQKKIPFSSRLTNLLGVRRLPSMSAKWMEILLQGFLYDDSDSYACDKVYREELVKYLKSYNFIIRNKVSFTTNEAIEKMLINSKGKMKSITSIVHTEYTSLGKKLRLLILTDYIRKEYRSAIGNPNADISSLGVLPFFEMLRRENIPGLKLGILCGGIIIIPSDAVSRLQDIAAEYEELKDRISFREITDKDGNALGYSEVSISGKKHVSTSLITRLFEEGYMHVLVGTKSLLGEGWDSPCINSLILASFVGSFVLSNQMRGRAIRVMKGNPDKTSNIWHLVCMNPDNTPSPSGDSGGLSEDFLTLERRMQGFLGLSYTGNTIENGLARIDCIAPPYTHRHIMQINEQMCKMSAQRDSLRKRWDEALVILDKMEVADECSAPEGKLLPGAFFINMWALEIASTIFGLFFAVAFISLMITTRRITVPVIFFLILSITGLVLTFKYGIRLFHILTPLRRLESMGNAVLRTLQDTGNITDTNVMVAVDGNSDLLSLTYLKGGSAREKNLYAECMLQLFAPVDNQRYLLYAPRCRSKILRYYCVPDIFAKSKESASLFQNALRKYIGNYDLIYTRNPNGRKILLKARSEAFANCNEVLASTAFNEPVRRRKVKSALV